MAQSGRCIDIVGAQEDITVTCGGIDIGIEENAASGFHIQGRNRRRNDSLVEGNVVVGLQHHRTATGVYGIGIGGGIRVRTAPKQRVRSPVGEGNIIFDGASPGTNATTSGGNHHRTARSSSRSVGGICVVGTRRNIATGSEGNIAAISLERCGIEGTGANSAVTGVEVNRPAISAAIRRSGNCKGGNIASGLDRDRPAILTARSRTGVDRTDICPTTATDDRNLPPRSIVGTCIDIPSDDIASCDRRDISSSRTPRTFKGCRGNAASGCTQSNIAPRIPGCGDIACREIAVGGD